MSVSLGPNVNPHAVEVCKVVEQLIRTFVSGPDSVIVESSTEMDKTAIKVRVSRADIGKVVGKEGRTARALRTILAAAGQANGHRFVLDIEERDEPESTDAARSDA